MVNYQLVSPQNNIYSLQFIWIIIGNNYCSGLNFFLWVTHSFFVRCWHWNSTKRSLPHSQKALLIIIRLSYDSKVKKYLRIFIQLYFLYLLIIIHQCWLVCFETIVRISKYLTLKKSTRNNAAKKRKINERANKE